MINKFITVNMCGVMIMILWSLSLTTHAADSVTAIALFNDRAMLSVNGARAKIVAAGDSHKGVKLVSSNTEQAVVEVNGQLETLSLNGTLVLSESLGVAAGDVSLAKVEIYVSPDGSFYERGQINGRNIEFLVDTGASLIVLSSQQANKIGLDYRNGERTLAATASGNAPIYTITLASVSLGDIELFDVQAGVIEGVFPAVPLLGMTFLSQVSMQREGNIMVLQER